MKLIVGLGNPGKKYEKTRHNVGFLVIDELAKRFNTKINKIKFKSVYGETNLFGEKIIFLKPSTYMNNSGEALREIRDFYKLDLEDIIVIYDDIDIDFAEIRVRKKGSSGSHNGMKSIIYHLQADSFPRIRIGIGKKAHPNQDLADFVLSTFGPDEIIDIEIAVKTAADAVEYMIKNGVDKTMNVYNGK